MDNSQANSIAYTGANLLIDNEKNLKNYNNWIVRKFIRCFRKNKFNENSVLDFGAGVGTLSTIFWKKTGIKPVVVEPDLQQRETLLARKFNTYKCIGDVEGQFDMVYTSNVLEHIKDDVAALSEIKNKLNPGGRLAIFVPAFEIIWTSMDDKVGHYRRYTIPMLRASLDKAGFEVEEISYRDSLGFIMAIAFKFIGNKSGEPSRFSLVLFDRIIFPVSLALDLVAKHIFGKNILAIAKPKNINP
ncbi:class I SAM-dependent methyltransferase [Mycetohabitans sp. B46]|uniref:class I SAM-dependent methyltransferase n=1 Tax=Mycetohabitans sp. B46 TaxID=2772536 RepID=UPI00307E3B66